MATCSGTTMAPPLANFVTMNSTRRCFIRRLFAANGRGYADLTQITGHEQRGAQGLRQSAKRTAAPGCGGLGKPQRLLRLDGHQPDGCGLPMARRRKTTKRSDLLPSYAPR